MPTRERIGGGVLAGPDGRRYYTVAAAAERLDVGHDTVRRDFDLIPAAGLVPVAKGPGRPPSKVVDFDLVERQRAEKLERLGVRSDESEVKDLLQRLRAVEAMYDELLDDYEELLDTHEVEHAALTKLRHRVLRDRRAVASGSRGLADVR
jgi:predicted ArsR family transcriptional regulator